MSSSSAAEVYRSRRRNEPRFVAMADKRVLGYFAVCCPIERPTGGGAATVVCKIHELPPGISEIHVWVAGWDCQFTQEGSTSGAERLISHAGVHTYAFQKDGEWFVQASMILADASDATHWFGWVDLFGIAIG